VKTLDRIAATKYRRLPGKGLRREGFISVTRTYCTLWLAPDHILNVDNHVFSEDYKRFYFQDIQAMITQKTKRGAVWNIILTILISLTVFTAFGRRSAEAMISWLIVAGILGLILLINWLRGPTCICHIITAVQQDTLPSLDRLKKAEKVLRILRQRIREVQGKLESSLIIGEESSPLQG
jgi:hypothetical protein